MRITDGDKPVGSKSTRLLTANLILVVPLALLAALLALFPPARPEIPAPTEDLALGVYGFVVMPVLFYLGTTWGYVWRRWRIKYLVFVDEATEIAGDSDDLWKASEWRAQDWASWLVPGLVVGAIFYESAFFFGTMPLWWLSCGVGAWSGRHGLPGFLAFVGVLQMPVAIFPLATGYSPVDGADMLTFVAAMTFSVGIFAGAMYLLASGFEDPPKS